MGVYFLLQALKVDRKSSFCHGGWLTLCVMYVNYKCLFLLNLSEYSLHIDIILNSLIIFVIIHNFKRLFYQIRKPLSHFLSWKLFFIVPLGYGLVLSILLHPTTIDVNSYHESRVLLLQQQNSYFLKAFNNVCEVVYGWGYDLVLHNHLRFGIDRGLGVYGYISFICILGLLHNFFRQPKLDKFSSIVPCLLFLGLIEPVYQSFSAKNDLPGALACLASYYAYTCWLKDKLEIHLVLSLLSLTWAVACKKTYLAFALPMLLYWGLQWLKNKQYIKLSFLKVVCLGMALLVVSPLITYIYNLVLWGNFSGPKYFVEHHTNSSLLYGTIANFFRYFFEVFHFPFFIEKFSSSLLEFSPVNFINNCWLNYFHPIFETHGESAWSFQVNWEQLEDSWFGPIGFILFLYFMYCLLKKSESNQIEIKVLLITYFFAICAMLAWRPFNDRYFTLFFSFTTLLCGTYLANRVMHNILKATLCISCTFLFLLVFIF